MTEEDGLPLALEVDVEPEPGAVLGRDQRRAPVRLETGQQRSRGQRAGVAGQVGPGANTVTATNGAAPAAVGPGRTVEKE